MSETLSRLCSEAEALGLDPQERKDYIRRGLDLEREREIRQQELDLERRKLEKEEKESLARIEREESDKRREHELAMERCRLEASERIHRNTNNNNATATSRLPRLPEFDDSKDDLDSWLTRFENFALRSEWKREDWTTYLSALLRGKALATYSRLPLREQGDYESVKKALQSRYHLTLDGYRDKFHQSKPEEGENASMFITRLQTYFERWMKLAEVDETYNGLRDFFVLERFMDACPEDLATHIREKKLSTLDGVVELVDAFLTARKRQLNDSMGQHVTRHTKKGMEIEANTAAFRGGKPGHKTTEGKTGTSKDQDVVKCFKCGKQGHTMRNCAGTGGNRQEDLRCFKCGKQGHTAKNCGAWNQVRGTGSAPKKAGAAVVRPAGVRSTKKLSTEKEAMEVKPMAEPSSFQGSTEDARINVKAEVTDGMLKLSMPVVTNCGICSKSRPAEDTRLPVLRGFVGNQEVDVLRDTGCEGVIVRRKLVSDGELTGKKCFIVRIDNTMLLAEEAVIKVMTPYLKGEVTALCIPDAICDLVVGNVDGARNPDDPEDWMVGAATTRAQAGREEEKKVLKVPKVERHGGVDRKELIRLQEEDQAIMKLADATEPKKRGNKSARFEKRQGVIYRIYEDGSQGTCVRQVVLPQRLRNYVMSIAHDSIMGGHQGIRKTRDKVISNFYWPGVEGDVARFCRSCEICQKTVHKGTVPRAPLQNIPLVDIPFKRVAIDIVGPIRPASEEGHQYILTLVDYATRYPEAVPLKRIDTETVAEALVNIYSRLGVPDEVLTDQGTQFISDCMKEVCRLLGISQSATTPYHPMCNGLVEKFNGTLKKTLRRLCSEQPKQWHRFINPLLFAYRDVPQESTKFAPFELLYGRTVRGPMRIMRQLWTKDIEEPEIKSSYQYVLELRERLEETWKLAQEELTKAQGKQKQYYDRRAKVRKFNPGDKVLVLLPTDTNKLLLQWKGPFEVESTVGINDYKVKMQNKTKTLHANLLKRFISRTENQRYEDGKASSTSAASAKQQLVNLTAKVSSGDDGYDGVQKRSVTIEGVKRTAIGEAVNDTTAVVSESVNDTTINDSTITEDPCDPACKGGIAVVEDDDYDDATASTEDLADLGTWGQRESYRDLKFGDNLTTEQRGHLLDLICRYRRIFSDVPGCCQLAEHRIDLTSEVPVRQRPYPVPYAMREALKSELRTMEDLGVIRRSSSAYASPLVVVKKKDGTDRICVDYRRLNKITVFDPHPSSHPSDVFQDLVGDNYFSTIDLSKGYWQIKVREEDVPKTAFVTMGEHYEFVRMPFGMMNSGATLNRAVKRLLDGMDNVTAYVDDLLVHTETWEEHLCTLERLFTRLEEAGITVRPTKCVLGAPEVDFVGHSLKRGIVGLHEDNISKVRDAPRPTTKKQVKSFLGLVGYYQDFIPNFAAVAAPLSDLLRKGQPNVIVWNEPQERAYLYLKNVIVSKPVLYLPDMKKDFILSTDASDRGIGATLMQEDNGRLHPIAFASRKLLPREVRYSVIERECLAIVWAVKRFQLYLYGRHFVLQTDHRPLEYIHATKFTSPRIMRWALCLQGYNFRIQHVKGKDNVGADFLSRVM